MPIQVLMPALSPTMEKGNLAKWLKREGDKVKSGDVIAEIETDKATMEVEAVDEGVLEALLVEDGDAGVQVNAPIARLGESDENYHSPAGGETRWGAAACGAGRRPPPGSRTLRRRTPATGLPSSARSPRARTSPSPVATGTE